MRILLLSQWFEPEPAIKGLAFARSLAAAGHEVQVITGFPNYPGGTLYPGYRLRLVQRESVEGVRVLRVLLYPSHNRSAVGRVLNYVSFAASTVIAGVFTRFKPDVIYAYHPPLTVGVAAALIGWLRRVPFVYDIQDLWPDTLAATGMISSHAVLRLVGRVARWVYRRASILIAQSPGFAARLADRGVPAAKIRLIYNWCDEGSLTPRARDAGVDLSRLDGRFNVVFAGNMGKVQALESVLDAAALTAVQDRRVQFVFVGGGTEVGKLQARARALGLANVVFYPRMEMSRVGHLLERADALLVHLEHSPLFAITIPSKTQAYLYAGKPIVMAVEGDAADLVTRAQAGVCVPPQDPGALAGAAIRLAELPSGALAEMGERGRRFYDTSLSLATGTQHMIEAFEHATTRPSRARG